MINNNDDNYIPEVNTLEIKDIKKQLVKMLGKDKVLTDELDLMYYSYDSSFLTKLEPGKPAAVVLPTSTEEVQKVVVLHTKMTLPSFKGAGTGNRWLYCFQRWYCSGCLPGMK